MEQSPFFLEASSSLASQEISRFLWNLKVRYCVREGLPLVPLLSHGNPLCAVPTCMFKDVPKNPTKVKASSNISPHADFYGGEFLATPQFQTGQPPFVGCPLLLIQ
jgi:hypothetical protein